MDWLDKMDLVLTTLYKESGHNSSLNDIVGYLDKKDIHKGEIEDILLYLWREGLIYCEYLGNRNHTYFDSIDSHFLISCKGKLFLEEHIGFKEKKKTEDFKNKEIISDLALRKRNDHRLVIGTFLVAAGAIGLIIWEMLKTFYLEKVCH